jgi:hypothetical protein
MSKLLFVVPNYSDFESIIKADENWKKYAIKFNLV